MTIATQNAKQIRDPMRVEVKFAARTAGDLTFSIAGDHIADHNLNDAVDNTAYSYRGVTQLHKTGFPVDGTCRWYDPGEDANADIGKVGIRTGSGQTVTIKVTSMAVMAALTILFEEGKGAVTVAGDRQDISTTNVFPVNGKTATIIIEPEPDSIVGIKDITPGVSVEFDNENLISCQLSLRADLTPGIAAFQTSEIEVQGYWPEDITNAVSKVGDNVPIYYRSGYADDMTDWRLFYMSEQATQKNGLVTLKGVDAAHLLEKKAVTTAVTCWSTKWAKANLWLHFVWLITSSGISLIHQQANPAAVGNGAAVNYLLWGDGSANDRVKDIINQTHVNGFWPVFVDAGWPTVTWSKPTPKWTISEDECGDVAVAIDRNVSSITSGDTNHPLITAVTRADTMTEIVEPKNVKAEGTYIVNSTDNWFGVTITNQMKRYWTTATSFAWRAKGTTKTITNVVKKKINGVWQNVTQKVTVNRAILRGYKVSTDFVGEKITAPDGRIGVNLDIPQHVYGQSKSGSALLYPNPGVAFNVSQETGSFRWKGNPKMQPRDVFNFVRIDGRTEVCTISEIKLVHEKGGTYADISYRKGLV